MKGVFNMAFDFLNDLGKKAQAVAAVAADKAKDAAELARINMSIASEQREIDKNFRAIGEWYVSEFSGEIPPAVKDLVDAVSAAKARLPSWRPASPRRKRLLRLHRTPTRPVPSAEPPPTASSAPSAAHPWASNLSIKNLCNKKARTNVRAFVVYVAFLPKTCFTAPSFRK